MRNLLMLVLLFTVYAGIFAQATQPPPPDTDNVTQGGLRVREPDGKVVECPLKHTDVTADISGFIARVKVTQTFYNPFDDKIEAVYVFPLSNTGAVDSMTMVIGNRRIVGVIKKKAEAREIYEEALRQGATASLLEQERPNVFTQSVGNIKPKQEVRIEITYIDVLKYDVGSYEFHFPMVVGPRYMPGNPTGKQGTGWAPDTDQVPDASRISPPVLKPGQRNGHDISLTLSLDAGLPIQGIHTFSHKSNITPVGDNGAKVMLLPEDAIPNKDFILRYKVAGEKPELAVLAHKPADGDGYFMLMLQPTVDANLLSSPPREMVFLLDKSGSMEGQPTEKVKQIMRACFKRSRPDDTVQVIAFSDSASKLFDKPVPATPENVTRCLNYTESLSGGGGTEMMTGINLALDEPPDPKRDRIVVLVTDAEVGNDDEIINAVAKKAGSHLRVWTFGVGAAPNRNLIDAVAKRGGGKSAIVDLPTDPDPLVGDALARIYKSQLEKIKINWGGIGVYDVLPRAIPDLWAGSPVVLFGKYTEGAAGHVTVSGIADGQPVSFGVDVSLPYSEYALHDVLPQVWARQKIDDLTAMMADNDDTPVIEEITQTALDYHLMSQYTSLVAVDESEIGQHTEPVTPPRRIAVPVPMPDGMSYEGVFGGAEEQFEMDGRAASAGDDTDATVSFANLAPSYTPTNRLRGLQGPQGAPSSGAYYSYSATSGKLGISTNTNLKAVAGVPAPATISAAPAPGKRGGISLGRPIGHASFSPKKTATSPPPPPAPCAPAPPPAGGGGRSSNDDITARETLPANQNAMMKAATSALEDARKLLTDGKSEEALRRAQLAVFLFRGAHNPDGMNQAIAQAMTARQACVDSYVKALPALNKPLELVIRNKSVADALKEVAQAGMLPFVIKTDTQQNSRITYLDLRHATVAQALEWILTPHLLTWRVDKDQVIIGQEWQFPDVFPWAYDIRDLTTPTVAERKAATKQQPVSDRRADLLQAVRAEIGQTDENAIAANAALYIGAGFLLVYGDEAAQAKAAGLLAGLRAAMPPLKGYEGLQTITAPRAVAYAWTRENAAAASEQAQALVAMRDWSWALLADAYNGQVDLEALTNLQAAWTSTQLDALLAGKDRLEALRSAWAITRAARRMPEDAELNILARLAYGKVGRQFAALTKALGEKPADTTRYLCLLYATLVAKQSPDGAGKPAWAIEGAVTLLLAFKDADPLRVVARGLLDPATGNRAALAKFFQDGSLKGQDLVVLGVQAAALTRGNTWQTARQSLPNLLTTQHMDGQIVILLNRMSTTYEQEWAKK